MCRSPRISVLRFEWVILDRHSFVTFSGTRQNYQKIHTNFLSTKQKNLKIHFRFRACLIETIFEFELVERKVFCSCFASNFSLTRTPFIKRRFLERRSKRTESTQYARNGSHSIRYWYVFIKYFKQWSLIQRLYFTTVLWIGQQKCN